MLEARLTALEAALADPSRHGSLEQLILDLARVATEEADAAVRHAYLEAEQEGQALAASVRAEERAALQAEQAAAASLRQGLQQALTALKAERTAGAARDSDLADLRQALDQARSELQMERTAIVARERDLSQAGQALEAEQTARSAERRQLDEMQAALRSERAAAQARDRELAAAQQALERELQNERADHTGVRQQLRDLQAAEKSLKDAQRTLRETQQALKDSEARADEAVRARQTLQLEFDAASQTPRTANDGDTVARELYEQLVETNARQIRSLELVSRDAETRAEAAERELDALRRALESQPAVPAHAAREEPAPAEATAAAATEGVVHKGLARSAKRVTMPKHLDIQIDGTPAKLIDLSLTGAQVLAPKALKPNRVMKLTLPFGDAVITCKGKIVWSRLEVDIKKDGKLWYRGGVLFTTSDEKALEAFLSSQP